MKYRVRGVDAVIHDYLGILGGLLIEGLRGCGKTSTGLHHARSAVRLDESPQILELAELSPQAILQGESPRLIDEWQLAPQLWNAVRHEIDLRRSPGQFILSGSATPDDDITRHTGAARFGRLRMRTMSLAESGRSTTQITLDDLRNADSLVGTSSLGYLDLAEEAVRGGWPAALDANPRQAAIFNRSYLEDVATSDVPLATGVRHDPVRMRRVLQSLARNTATEVELGTIAADVSADGGAMAPETVRAYLDALTRVFVLEELPAWSVALRSRSRLRTSAKLMFTEPALACGALGVSADRLAADPEFFGQIFEAMVVRDLRSLVATEHASVYHYRDNTGLEVDIIIEFADQSWAAVEVKLGQSRVGEGERNLLKLRDERVDTARVGAPQFLAVITGAEHAYTLPSGVHVVPLGALAAR